jgi:hypothetical protein
MISSGPLSGVQKPCSRAAPQMWALRAPPAITEAARIELRCSAVQAESGRGASHACSLPALALHLKSTLPDVLRSSDLATNRSTSGILIGWLAAVVRQP